MACSLAIRIPLLACLSFVFLTRQVNVCFKDGQQVPCWPNQESCGAPFEAAPRYHLMNQNGCGENDPNGPVFDPVHGVIHHFYQDHLGAHEGGPVYGHFVSKDFVHWAALPVAIWNGIDASSDPPRMTLYDTRAIYTGSAVVVNGAGPNGTPGVVQIYPGLCDTHWPDCQSGTLLAQAVPANYSDVLLVNWTKPSYNPIMPNTQRDPSSPWKEASGEWRLRTYDGQFYGAASDADLLKGKWYELGAGNVSMWPTCECPSFFPLPGPTPGFEKDYYRSKETLPSHVQKLSCGEKDWWMIGTYTLEKGSRTIGSFTPTKGWEDLYERQLIDAGSFYASKDALYPTKTGGQRRINWGWGIWLRPDGTQTLPRVITFNPVARRLEQAPLPELQDLRSQQLLSASVQVDGTHPWRFRLPFLSLAQSETSIRFTLPDSEGIMRIGFAFPESSWWMEATNLTGPEINPPRMASSAFACQETCQQETQCLAWSFVNGTCHLKAGVDGALRGVKDDVSGVKKDLPPVSCAVYYVSKDQHDSDAICGTVKDKVRLLPGEKTLDLQIFSDATFLEVFFQQGRTAMTVPNTTALATEIIISSTVDTLVEVSSYAMKSIWVSEDFVRKQPRIYGTHAANELRS